MYTRNRGVGCISSAHTRAACGNDSDSGRRAHIGGVPSSQLVSRLIRWCRPRKRILASNHPLRALAVSRFQSKTRTKGNSQSDSGIGNTGNNRAALPLRRWTKPYGQGVGLCFSDESQKGAAAVGENLGERLHRREPRSGGRAADPPATARVRAFICSFPTSTIGRQPGGSHSPNVWGLVLPSDPRLAHIGFLLWLKVLGIGDRFGCPASLRRIPCNFGSLFWR